MSDSDGNDVQPLNVELGKLLDEWDAAGRPASSRACSATMMARLIGMARAEGVDVSGVLRGRRSIVDALLYGFSSRSGNFETKRAGHVLEAALELGLVTEGSEWRDTRDAQTGKPVATRLREVARLKYDWTSDEDREWLKASWPQIVAMKMIDLKRWVRKRNRDSTAWLTRPELKDVLERTIDDYQRLYGVDDDEVWGAVEAVYKRMQSLG